MNETTDMPLLLVGTYTEKEPHVDGKAEGIYLYAMDTATGKLQHISTARGIKNPSFVAIHPNKQYVYAVSEIAGNDTIDTGLVYAYRLDSSRQFTQINVVSSEGTAPCNVSVDPSGKFAMAANYGSGTVALMSIGADGALSPASSVKHEGKGPTARQESPHAHMVIPHKSSDIYAVDLGIDQIKHYKLNEGAKKLEPTPSNTAVAPGSGPRQLTFHPTQPWAYVINELSGSVMAFKVNEDGALKQFQTITTLPDTIESKDAGSADIHITPSGKYLYASNRGSYNNIAMFAIDQTTGQLSLIGFQSAKGKAPRNFAIDPSGTFLLVANQDTGNVVTFRIDASTGKLIDTGVETAIPTPVCLQFIP